MNESRFYLENLKHYGVTSEQIYRFSLAYNSYLNSFFVESFVENEFIDVTKYSETDIGFEDAVIDLNSSTLVDYASRVLRLKSGRVRPDILAVCKALKAACLAVESNQEYQAEVKKGQTKVKERNQHEA